MMTSAACGELNAVDWRTHVVCIADEACRYLDHSRLEASPHVVIELFPGRWREQHGVHHSQNYSPPLRKLTSLHRSSYVWTANLISLCLLTCWKERWFDIFTAVNTGILDFWFMIACRGIFNVPPLSFQLPVALSVLRKVYIHLSIQQKAISLNGSGGP
jgi:hypothetical protein